MAEPTAPLTPLVFAVLAAAGLALGVAVAIVRPVVGRLHAVGVLTAVAAVVVVALLTLVRPEPPGLRLVLDPSTEPLLPSGDPARELYERAVLEFGDDEVYVIVAECGDVFTPRCLGSVQALSERLAHVPGVRSVRNLLDATSFRYVPAEDWIEVRPFIEAIPTDPAALAALRERAVADPVYRQTLVSLDARSTALNLRFRDMTDAEFVAADVDGTIARILAAERHDGLRFHVAGRPHAKSRVYHGMLRDLRLLIPLALVAAALVLLLTGSGFALVLPLATAATACLWTFAGMVAVGAPLTILTGMLTPTLLALGCAHGVHVVARCEEDPDGLRALAVPVGIAGLTTIAGFGALLLSDVPAVFALGAFGMLGMGSVTLLSLTAVPAALRLRRDARRPRPLLPGVARRLADRIEAVTRRATRLATDHATAVIAVASVAAVLAVAALPRITIDTDYLSYFAEDDPVRRDFEAVNRLMAGAVPLYVSIDAGKPGAFRDPALLAQLEVLQQRLDAVPGVSRTLSFLDTLRMLNRAFVAGDAADDPAGDRLPRTRGGVTGLLFMIPKGEVQPFLTVNHARANLVVRTGEVGSAAIRALVRRLEAAIDATDFPESVTALVTGNAVLLARSADGIAQGQPRSVALAALAIFLCIAVGLRSPRLGLVAMLPNLLPVLWFFGLLGAGLAPLSLPTSLIGCVALGIAIDDTAHYLVRYRNERLRGRTPGEAVAACGRVVGRPIVITSAMLVLGFLVLCASTFASLQAFGALIGVTMALCLISDLLLLPALLVRLRI